MPSNPSLTEFPCRELVGRQSERMEIRTCSWWLLVEGRPRDRGGREAWLRGGGWDEELSVTFAVYSLFRKVLGDPLPAMEAAWEREREVRVPAKGGKMSPDCAAEWEGKLWLQWVQMLAMSYPGGY